MPLGLLWFSQRGRADFQAPSELPRRQEVAIKVPAWDGQVAQSSNSWPTTSAAPRSADEAAKNLCEIGVYELLRNR